MDQWTEVRRVDRRHVRDDAGRHRQQDVGGEATLGGERFHLAPEVLALTQRPRHVQQQLRQVSADLALDPDGHHGPFEVLAVHATTDGLECVLDRDTEPRLDQCSPELSGQRLLALTDDGVQRLGQRETGLEAAGHELQAAGELAVERLDPPRPLEPEEEPREKDPGDQPDQTEQEAATAEGESDSGRAHGDAAVQEQPLRGLERDRGGLEPVVELGLETAAGLQRLVGNVDGLRGDALGRRGPADGTLPAPGARVGVDAALERLLRLPDTAEEPHEDQQQADAEGDQAAQHQVRRHRDVLGSHLQLGRRGDRRLRLRLHARQRHVRRVAVGLAARVDGDVQGSVGVDSRGHWRADLDLLRERARLGGEDAGQRLGVVRAEHRTATRA